MRKVIRFGAFLIPLTMLTYSTAQAQELLPEETEQTEVAAQGEDLFEVSLEDLLNLNMELSTGSFLELDRKSSAVSMTIITESQVENSGARHLSELLEIYVPGFQYMYNKWNGIIWGMRGVAADRNTKFIFLVNGHKMNHESRDGAMSELDLGLLGDIERVEVLRGPAGLVYGSGAIAGVVNIVTKSYVADAGEVAMGLNTWNMQSGGGQAEATVHKVINDETSLTVGLGYRQSNGVGAEQSRIYGPASWPYPAWINDNVPTNGVPTSGSAWSTPGNGKATIDFKYKNLRFYSRTTHQVTNASGLFPVDGWPDIAGGLDSTAESRFVDGDNRDYKSFYAQIEPWGTNRRQYIIDNMSNELSYKYDVGENALNFKLGMDAVSNRIVNEDLKSNTTQAPAERKTVVNETFGERRYNFSTMYQVKTIDRAQLAIGYEFKLFDIGRDMAGNNSVGGYPNHLVVDNVRYTNNAIFGEGVYNVTDKFDVNLGARYDAHTRTIKHGGVLSPKLGLIYKANEKNTFKLVYQQSANNGSADNYEFGRNSMNNQGVKSTGDVYRYENPTQKPGNDQDVLPPVTNALLQELKPERASSLELMTVHEVGSGLVVMPSVSYNIIKDLFVWNQDLFRVMNGGKYSFLNVDLEAKYASTKIDIGASHTLQLLTNKNDINSSLNYNTKVFDGYDSTVTNGIVEYTPHLLKDKNGNDSTVTQKIEPIKTSISSDGTNFANLVKNVTKLYIDYKPASWINFHTDARIFWGLNGRKDAFDATTAHNNLSVHKSSAPIIKWNLGISVKADEKWRVAFYVYDVLGSKNNPRHTIRWQQRGTPDQNDLYSTDYRSMALNIEYKF